MEPAVDAPDARARLRPGAVGATAVLLGIAAHGAAGPWDAPATGPVATAAVAVCLVALAAISGSAAGAPLRAGSVLARLAAVQVALHVVLATGHAGMPGMAHGSSSGHGAHGHGLPAPVVEPGTTSWSMLAAHAAVTLLVAALIVGADRAALRVLALSTAGAVRALRRLLPSGTPLVPAPAAGTRQRLPVPMVAPCPSPGLVSVRAHPRRGPPRGTSTTSLTTPRRPGAHPCPQPARHAPSPA